MMNEFGTPFNEAEEAMRPKGIGHRHIDKELAASGMESQLLPVLIGAGLGAAAGAGAFGAAVAGVVGGSALAGGLVGAGLGGQVGGGLNAAKAARSQAEAANAASDRQYYYDTAAWEMKKDQIRSDREHAVLELETRAENEQTVNEYRDALNLQKYNYDVQIRANEQESLDKQFEKSNEIYNVQMDYNAMAEQSAMDQEYHKLEEIKAEARFDDEDIRLQALMDEGKLRALGQSGNTLDQQVHGIWLKAGKRIAAINASIESAGRASRSIIKEIGLDKDTADLQAFASKMLDPGVLPDVIEPIALPYTEWVMPRALEEYDFGPAPVKGAFYDPGAAAGRAWGTTMSSIAGMIPSYGKFLGL